MRRGWLLTLAFVVSTGTGRAQIEKWQLGGSGLAWSARDSLQVLIDYETAPGSIQPRYLQADQNVLPLLQNWQFLRIPGERELGYVDGQMPRLWFSWSGTAIVPTFFLIDPDSTSYIPPQSQSISGQFFTFDTAVPIPAFQFGFFTPPRGFRSDGTPLSTDATPAFDVSMGTDSEPAVNWGGNDLLQKVIANVAENHAPTVRLDFPRQYVRFFRWRRRSSLADEEAFNTCADCGGQGNQARALKGSIGGFEVFAHGVPQRAVYLSQIVDLGRIVNFGRLHWKATPIRLVDGVTMEDADAPVWLRAEVRVGRDGDPTIYREFTHIGREKEVSRAHYEALSPLLDRDPRPGMRASIGYDSENWSFWSVPLTESGQQLRIRSGSHLQLELTLESRDFDAWIRLDSLWIETAPLLAHEVLGEVARLDDPQPTRGYTQVSLGEPTQFVYDIQASFAGESSGFDALRIRTGNRVVFRRLEMGAPLAAVDPAHVREEEDGLSIHLPAKITRANNVPIRVLFTGEVFEFAATFEGEIFVADSQSLPQPIIAGDASKALATNSLRVLSAAGQAPDFIQSLALSTPVLTPNGDGVHDRLHIEYSLFRLPGPVPVALEVYALDGRRLARIDKGLQDSGPRQLDWDGRDEAGHLLPPGLYLLSVSLQTQHARSGILRTLGIAY